MYKNAFYYFCHYFLFHTTSCSKRPIYTIKPRLQGKSLYNFLITIKINLTIIVKISYLFLTKNYRHKRDAFYEKITFKLILIFCNKQQYIMSSISSLYAIVQSNRRTKSDSIQISYKHDLAAPQVHE